MNVSNRSAVLQRDADGRRPPRHPPEARRRSSCRTWRPACRWCVSTPCPARRDDLEQLIRWQLKKSAPFPDRGRLRQLDARHGGRPTAAASSWSCWRARRRSVNTRASARTSGLHAGLVRPLDLQRHQLLPGRRQRAERRLAAACTCAPTTRRLPSCAAPTSSSSATDRKATAALR